MARDTEKVRALLGLARRAGKVALGRTAVRAALNRGEAELIILAVDASERTRDTFVRLARRESVVVTRVLPKAGLGAVLGTTPKAVCAVCDSNFARGIGSALGLEEFC